MKRLSLSLSWSVGVSMVCLGLALVGALVLASPLLNDIVDHAEDLTDQRLPEITRWRQNTQRVERLYSVINTVYWTVDEQTARSFRLQAQVLVNSFSFEPTPYLAPRAQEILLKIKKIERLRQQQRAVIDQIRAQAAGFAANTDVDPNSVTMRWVTQLEHLQLSEKAIADLAVTAYDQHQPLADLSQPVLERLRTQFNRLELLSQSATEVYNSAILEQQELATLLVSDATLALQQIADSTKHKAEVVRTVGLGLLLFLVGGLLVILILFHRYILRPIFDCDQALNQLGDHVEPTAPPPTLFRELESISANVRNSIKLTQELQSLSSRDALTGLRNRRGFDELFERELRRAKRQGYSMNLVMFDLDYFKRINDTYGHPFGDECLKAFAGVLADYTRRAPDVAARYGGEEFVMLLPELDLDKARAVAEQIRMETSELVLIAPSKESVTLTTSAGLVNASTVEKISGGVLMEQADQALYRAKQLGRDQVVSVQL